MDRRTTQTTRADITAGVKTSIQNLSTRSTMIWGIREMGTRSNIITTDRTHVTARAHANALMQSRMSLESGILLVRRGDDV